MFMQPVYLHVSRGLNGRETGLLLLPGSIFGSATSLYAGWHMRVSRCDISVGWGAERQRFKEYKWFVVSVSVIPSLQALSIMTNWGIDTNVHRLWVEMTIGQMGGGAVLTALLVALIAVVDVSDPHVIDPQTGARLKYPRKASYPSPSPRRTCSERSARSLAWRSQPRSNNPSCPPNFSGACRTNPRILSARSSRNPRRSSRGLNRRSNSKLGWRICAVSRECLGL